MKKVTKFLVPLMLGLLILASIVWYLFIYDRDFTRDTLLSQARFQDMHGNTRMSAMFYNAAYAFSGGDESVAIELANQYKHDGNYTKAEYTLTKSISEDPTPELYVALSRAYVEQDKLLDAVNLLDNISDPAIKAAVDEMRPSAPKSDYKDGYYSQYMDIHLKSDGKYIFYSVDGTYPSTNGAYYDRKITLPAGETTLYAIAVGEDGLVSPVTVLGYTITGVIEEVTFTDSTMEAAIREAIGKSAGKAVYTDELWEITEFTVPEGVKDFSDLSLLSYVTDLTINGQNISSLAPLSSLTKLESLDLSGCSFPANDLSVIAGLPALTHLDLENCGISTIAELEGSTSLTHLNLSNNTVRNLEVLTAMKDLTELNLEHNAVTDLSALGSLEKLETLLVSYNALTSLSPLSGCIRLKHLEVNINQLSNLNGVEKLPLLTLLYADDNQLTNVSLLTANTDLTDLSIASNNITDITALSVLTKLENFNFSGNIQISALPQWPDGSALKTIDGSYNALTSIDSLKNLQSLTHVYMDYNQITNIDALENCFCLVQINVFGNVIADVSALRDHDIIVNYDPTAA